MIWNTATCRSSFLLELEKMAESSHKKQAVIIKGNPDHILASGTSPGLTRRFHGKLRKILESEGYQVSWDLGLPYTTPKAADVWIGHSRGADRLRFAPKGTTTIAIGSDTAGAINHPKDAQWMRKYRHLDMSKTPVNKRPAVISEHMMITPAMEKALRRKVSGPKRGREKNAFLLELEKIATSVSGYTR